MAESTQKKYVKNHGLRFSAIFSMKCMKFYEFVIFITFKFIFVQKNHRFFVAYGKPHKSIRSQLLFSL